MSIKITGYQLGREVSAGRFFTLYNALEEKTSNPVTVRIYNHPSAYSDRFIEGFQKAGAKLKQQQLGVMVPVKQAAVTSEGCYVVSDYFPSFQRQAESSGQFPFNRMLDFGFQLACTLDMIHQLGLIHGGIEVSSLYFPDSSHIVLGPVAFHRILADSVVDTLSADSDDLNYLAPEVWQRGLSPATDFYALGVVLYELLMRRKPFPAKDMQQLQQFQRESEVEIPDSRFTHLLPLFQSLLSAEPNFRIQNAQMFQESLRQCGLNMEKPAFAMAKITVPSGPQGVSAGTPVKSRGRIKILALGVFVISASLGVYLLTGRDKAEQKPRRNIDQLRNSTSLVTELNESGPSENDRLTAVPVREVHVPPVSVRQAAPNPVLKTQPDSDLEIQHNPAVDVMDHSNPVPDTGSTPLPESPPVANREITALSKPVQEAPSSAVHEVESNPVAMLQGLYQQAELEVKKNNPDSALIIINSLLEKNKTNARALQLKSQIEKEIATHDMIEKANQQLRAGRASKPYGDNALRTYRQLELMLGEKDKRVEQGYRDIAVFYHLRATRLFERQQFVRSQVFVDRGLSIVADYAPLIQLQEKIQQQQQLADEQAQQVLQAKVARQQQLELQQQLKQQKISALLERGRRILRAESPDLAALSDAGDLYFQAVKLEPNDPASLQLREQIVETYVFESDRLSAAGDLDAAQKMVDAGLEFADQNVALLQLKQRISSAQKLRIATPPKVAVPAAGDEPAAPAVEEPKPFVPVIGTF